MNGLNLPRGLSRWRDLPEGEAWLARLPAIVEACAEEWRLRLGEPFEARYSLVVPVETAAGADAVLKVSFPDVESELEPAGGSPAPSFRISIDKQPPWQHNMPLRVSRAAMCGTTSS